MQIKVKMDFTDLKRVSKEIGRIVVNHDPFSESISRAFKKDLRVQYQGDGFDDSGASGIWSENTQAWDDHKIRVTGFAKKMFYFGKLVGSLLFQKVQIIKKGNLVSYLWEWTAKRKDFDYAEHYQRGAKHPREFVITPALQADLEKILVKKLEAEISKL